MITTFSVDECWAGRWLGRSTLAAENGRFRLAMDTDPPPADHLRGTVFTGFRDSHVHLGLVDGRALANAGIAAVDDLGWDAEQIALWSKEPDFPEVRFAGRILTSLDGYPSRSGWAPDGTCELLAAPADAKGAVSRQLSAGASLIKVALNSDAGPTLDDATLVAVVSHAHARGVKVVAHVQGAGQAERAWDAGVDRLAHTPWSERLDDRLIAAMARTQSWVSTLDIHGWGEYGTDYFVGLDNLRRFHAAGGGVLYGTDLGNGPLPVGINTRELQALESAGLGLVALVTAIAGNGFGTSGAHDNGNGKNGAAKNGHSKNGHAKHGGAVGPIDFGRKLSHISSVPTVPYSAWLSTAHTLDATPLEGELV